MSELLVIGALAWDRPIRLLSPLAVGGRVAGRTLDGRMGGRLGGGGANAAVALAKAGRAVALASAIASDAVADTALEEVASAGVDTRLIVRRDGDSKITLILIDPAGERIVLGLDADPAALPTVPGPAKAPDFRPSGLFIRTPYRGAAEWSEACTGPVIAHWPAPKLTARARVLVASADDLDSRVLDSHLAAARAALGDDVDWVVVTRGVGGATAHGDAGAIHVPAPRAAVVDATGAGDIFAAGLLDALSAGAAMERALVHACAWGAAAVTINGSAPVAPPPGTFAPYPS